MLVTKQIEIDMAHRVPNHKSKCKNLHGHRYKIELGCDDKIIDTRGVSDEGMVIDFSDMKQILMDEIDTKFDHGAIFYYNDPIVNIINQLKEFQNPIKIHFVDFIPTAENLCKYWYQLLKEPLEQRNIKIKYVKVWETPTSTAIYEE